MLEPDEQRRPRMAEHELSGLAGRRRASVVREYLEPRVWKRWFRWRVDRDDGAQLGLPPAVPKQDPSLAYCVAQPAPRVIVD